MISMPIAPVMAPDDRSNSPPIMSIDTATAMIPTVDAVSSQPKVWPTVPKVSETAQKKVQIPTIPMIAPTSGRMKSR
jgi:hypothetical protein